MKSLTKLLGGLMILAIIAVMAALPSNMAAPAATAGRSATGSASSAQNAPGIEQWVGAPVAPTLTQAVRDLPPYVVQPQLDREINPRMSTNDALDPNFRVKSGIDPLLAVQAEAPAASPDGFGTPIFNFNGDGYQFLNPPDTIGDVGANHYIQMVNATVVSIYNKTTGALIQTFDLTALGGCATGSGDPIVLYDQLADRWFLSEFGSGSSLCVFISQTPDPQGAYYSYQFSTPSFPDYPKYGVWPDAYYATANESSPSVFALDRAKMLAGLPATSQRFTAPGLSGFGFQALDAGRPGRHDAAAGRRARLHHAPSRHRGPWPGRLARPSDFLEIWAFHVDWTTPANSTFTQLARHPDGRVRLRPLWPDLVLLHRHARRAAGSRSSLDPLREVIMFRLAYRNFGDHETLVGNFVTDVDGNDQAGVRWFELRKVGRGAWTPLPGRHLLARRDNRWMGAIAMDGAGNIALGYNVSSHRRLPRPALRRPPGS